MVAPPGNTDTGPTIQVSVVRGKISELGGAGSWQGVPEEQP